MKRNGKQKQRACENFRFFASTDEFADTCAKNFNQLKRGYFDTGWMGGTMEDALRLATHGDTTLVNKAERLLDKIDAEIDSNELKPQWQASVAGYIPIVPAYLAGEPQAMLTRTDMPDPRGDVEIWVEMGCSACVSQEDMERRAIITLAAALALSRIRNVRIKLWTGYHTPNIVIPLASPLNIAEASAYLARTSITRGLIYKYCNWIGSSQFLTWAYWNQGYEETQVRNTLQTYAQMPADAEIITKQRIGDWGDMTDGQLIEAINAMLRRHIPNQNEIQD